MASRLVGRERRLSNLAGGAPLTPEQRLVAAASRVRVAGQPVSVVAELARAPRLRWDVVARLARWQRVSALLLRNLSEAGALGEVPPVVAGALQAEYAETVARNLRRGKELERLGLAMAGAGIPVLLLKGAALVPDYYPDPGLRPMADLDVLVPDPALATAAGLARDLGYREAGGYDLPPGHHCWPPLVSDDGLVALELHRRLGSQGALLDFSVDGLWGRAGTARRGAASYRTPSPADLVLHLGLHFLEHHVNRSYGALGQLADIALVVERAGTALDWDVVWRDASAWGVTRPLALALGVVGALLGVDVVVPPAGAGAADGALISEFVRRRVFRAEAWRSLEEVSPRTGAVRQLLPPRPAGAWRRGDRRVGAFAGTYSGWSRAAVRVLAHPGDVRAERAFDRELASVLRPDRGS